MSLPALYLDARPLNPSSRKTQTASAAPLVSSRSPNFFEEFQLVNRPKPFLFSAVPCCLAYEHKVSCGFSIIRGTVGKRAALEYKDLAFYLFVVYFEMVNTLGP